MHFRHKWETIFRKAATVTLTYHPNTAYAYSKDREAAFIIKRCKVCGKEKGYYSILDGTTWNCDPEYIRARFGVV